MKTIIVAAIALLLSCTAVAQNLVPEFKNQPMLLNGGALDKLEKQAAEVKSHGPGAVIGNYYGTGYAHTEIVYLTGSKSDVRTGTQPVFVIKVDADVDPETVFYLAVGKSTKKAREIELSKQGAVGTGGKSVKRLHVKLVFEKISDNVFKVRPEKPLEDGEYAFIRISQTSTSGNSTVYAFGVGK